MADLSHPTFLETPSLETAQQDTRVVETPDQPQLAKLLYVTPRYFPIQSYRTLIAPLGLLAARRAGLLSLSGNVLAGRMS